MITRSLEERAKYFSSTYYPGFTFARPKVEKCYRMGALEQFNIDKQMALDIVSNITNEIINSMGAPELMTEPWKSNVDDIVNKYINNHFKLN